jgi:hypothetical protein
MQNVILDSDVAELYGVETMRINEAIKNNPDKFPEGYVFELSKAEKQKVIEIFDNPNPKIKFSPVLPKAFTEKGLYVLATILKSCSCMLFMGKIDFIFYTISYLYSFIAKLLNSCTDILSNKSFCHSV